MIGDRELERRAAALGISVGHVELDYVLNHVLAQLAEDPRQLIFRGGTALARAYWPDFRISEDLDFISADLSPELESQMVRAVERASEASGLSLEAEVGRRRDDRIRSFVRWSTPWGSVGEILVDVVTAERPTLPATQRSLVLPYSDLAGVTDPIATVDVHEILASKWVMLDDRDEPRDLFDLWWGLAREGIPFEVLANAHEAKYRYPPMPASIERARRLERAWTQRLGYQVARLPPFDEVLVAVEQRFESWRDSVQR